MWLVGVGGIYGQGCRIGAMTPFTAPGNASGRRCFFGATIITYTCTIIIYKASNLSLAPTYWPQLN